MTCVNELKTWLNSNSLSLNLTKTEVLLVGPPTVTKNITDPPKIDLEATSIFPTATVKNLGIILDSSLNLDAYISKLSKAAFFQLRRIAKLRSFMSPKDAESLVHAFITSRLDYCNALFSGLSVRSISRLQYIQNSAARMLTYTKRSAHITPILFNLHWLPVSSRIIYKILLLTFKSLHGLAPTYLSDLLSPYTPSRLLRSSGEELLCVPRSRLSSMGGRSFSVMAPKVWNSLPLCLRSITTLHEFKSKLNTYLFNQYYRSLPVSS